MEKQKALVGEVSLQDLLDRLSFAEEGLQQAALEQAKLFMAAASYRINRMKDRQEAESKYEDLRVSRSLKLRMKYLTGGKKSVTEKHINDLIDHDQEIRDARDEVLKAKRREEYSKLLLDSYDHRRSSIKVLAQFAYVEDSMKLGESLKDKRERLKSALPKRLPEDDE